jgi:hypothetical protein
LCGSLQIDLLHVLLITEISIVFAPSSRGTVLCCDVARSRCGVKGSGEVPRLGRTFPLWDHGVTSAFFTVHVTCQQAITSNDMTRVVSYELRVTKHTETLLYITSAPLLRTAKEPPKLATELANLT